MLLRKNNPVTEKDHEIANRLIRARIYLITKHNFFGLICMRMRMVRVDDWLPTAATDGLHLFYNNDFIDSLTDEELVFLLCHEVLHCVFDHIGRCGDRNRYLHNVAADYAINQILVDEKIGEPIKLKKGDLEKLKESNKKRKNKIKIDIKEGDFIGFQDDKYRNLSSEKIYDMMIDEIKQDLKGEGMSDEDIEDYINGLGKILIDDHGAWEDAKDEDGNPLYTDEEKEEIRRQMREAVLESARQNQGKLPGDIERMLGEFLRPKKNWRELLQQHIKSTIKANYTFMRPNKKSLGGGTVAILPSQLPETTIDIALAIDTSGSISDKQLKEFLSEIKGIMDQHIEFKMHLWCFDTKVYNYQIFDQMNSEDLYSYKPMGGGGTDFDVNWEFMMDESIHPEKFVMFTDGYCDVWGDPDYCDTIWLINDGDSTIEAPHGVTVYYED